MLIKKHHKLGTIKVHLYTCIKVVYMVCFFKLPVSNVVRLCTIDFSVCLSDILVLSSKLYCLILPLFILFNDEIRMLPELRQMLI